MLGMCLHRAGGESLAQAHVQLKRRWAHRPGVAKVMEVVDEAAQLIDRGSLQTTRFLSHNPYVRLCVATGMLHFVTALVGDGSVDAPGAW